MALIKKIELDNGVIVNYHRIVSINKITNHSIVLEIGSYTSGEKRQEEIENQEMNVFIDTTYMSVDYDESKEIKDFYDYLKTTDEFKDAENC